MHKETFGEKALTAVESVFSSHDEISLEKVKRVAKTFCQSQNLNQLCSRIERSKNLSLQLFFSAKTHKPECPLRVIISERETWQKSVGVYLQERLKLLVIDDPYLIHSSYDVISFFDQNSDLDLRAFSIDIKDLYYSLPQPHLLRCIEDCIDTYGITAFQNAAGLSQSKFLNLLDIYLKSTFATWDGHTYLQKRGVCIGSCIAPILSDLYLAHLDRNLNQTLDGSKVKKVFRYVDDYLIVLATDDQNLTALVPDILNSFKRCMNPLEITHELPSERSLRFLDLRLCTSPYHTCWTYEPRGKKPLLPFNSAHSKLVKRGIARLCLKNSLTKSCFHSIQRSFDGQVSRLKRAGYPPSLLISVAEGLFRDFKHDERIKKSHRDRAKRPVIVPYLHHFSHGLKKIANKVGTDVIFSAPNKLYSLCKRVNTPSRTPTSCTTNHRNKFVRCTENVVYSFPLSCGRTYIGQTGRCLNHRLREHNLSTINKNSGHVGIHIRDCGCTAELDKCVVLARSRDQLTREIIEAENIARQNGRCISNPSIALSQKELDYLALHH